MADAKQLKQKARQIRIKTGSCRRLTKDLKTYIDEKNDFMKKLQDLKEQGADKYKLKTQRELLEETCAVIINIHQKVKAAYEALDRIVGDSRSEEALSQTEEFQKAVQQLQETHNTLNPPKKPAAAAAPKDGAVAQVLDKAKTVAVFGSSSAKPGSPEYKAALALGAGLAQRQIQILSGGYGGLMEATSKGASATAGAVIAGVLVPTVFPQRKNGNDFLTRKIEAKSLEGRIATMVGSARAFVVLPGNLGTLTELFVAWNVAVLSPLAGKPPPPIIAFEDPWRGIISAVSSSLKVPQPMLDMIQFVSNESEALDVLDKAIGSS